MEGCREREESQDTSLLSTGVWFPSVRMDGAEEVLEGKSAVHPCF